MAVVGEIVLETILSLRYRTIAHKNPQNPLLATTVIYGLGVLPVGVVFWIISGASLPSLELSAIFWIITASALFASANVLIYKAYSKMDASLYAIINSSKYVVIVLGAMIILGDDFNSKQLIGAALILLANIYVSAVARHSHKQRVRLQFVFLAFGASIMIAVAQLSERIVLELAPIATYMLIGWGLQVIILILFSRPTRYKMRHLQRAGLLRQLVTTGVLRGLAGVCIVYAVAATQNASLVFSLAATKVIAVAVAGYIFLNERLYAKERIGAALVTLVGIVLILI